MASHDIVQVSHLITSEIHAEVIRPVASTKFEKPGEWAEGIHTKLNKDKYSLGQLWGDNPMTISASQVAALLKRRWGWGRQSCTRGSVDSHSVQETAHWVAPEDPRACRKQYHSPHWGMLLLVRVQRPPPANTPVTL